MSSFERWFFVRNCIKMSCLASTAMAGAAIAQDSGTGVGLADIIVTAQKSAQNVQDVPLSVTAVTGEALTSQGIQTVQELNRVDPALQIGQSTGTVITFIRGIGNPVTTAGNEASVPVYIDDVYFVRAAHAFFDLSSVDRVEVLKGPQGTLFGRNASGGVISIYTKDPSPEPALEARLGYGNYDTMDAKLYGNLPIGENLAANVALSYHNQDRGWGRNRKLVDQLDTSKGYLPGGNDYWKAHSFSARGKILWEPTDTTSIKLIGYYMNSWNQIGIYARPLPGTLGGTPDSAHNGGASVSAIPGGAPVPSQFLPALDFYDVTLDHEMADVNEGWGASVRLDQELGFADFVSITAYRKADELLSSAGNYSPYDWLIYDLNIVDKQFTQEFQLKSNAASAVKWIAGLYYLNADGGFDPTTIRGPGQTGNGIQAVNLYGQQKVKSYAAFGQVTIPLGEMTNITGGLRYTIDKVIGNGRTDLLFVGATTPLTVFTNADKETFKKLTWKGSIDHKFTDDIMVYANISRGYKAGTFNTLPLDSPALQPEVVDAYEIGLKSELLDRRLRFNLALFWNDISDPQVQAQRNGLVFLKNAGSARTKGVEFDITAAPAEGLTLRLGGSYLDAKFREFPDAPSYCPSPVIDAVTCQALTPTLPVVPGNINTIVVDAGGNRMPYASKWKFSGSINYARDVANAGRFTFDLGGSYASPFNWDADNVFKESKTFLLDGSIAFTPEAAEHLTLRFWMKNITGEKYNLNYYPQASGSAYSSAPGAPRTYGGEVVFKF